VKIPTLTILESAIQRDLSWRRKELSSLYLSAISAIAGSDAQSRASRAGIVLSYAHLEGFARESTRYYLSYVKGRFLRWSELSPNFIALKLSKMVSQGTAKVSYYGDAAVYLSSKMNDIADLPSVEVITAKSNLTFAQFSEMLYTINIDPAPFETKRNFFDIVLLERRNAIAHGEERKTSLDDYLEVHSEILEILDDLSDLLMDSASNKAFLRN
jgi:hypothetical protein